MCACERGLEDRSKPLQVFEELPGSFPIMSRGLKGGWGRLGVKECTDVLSDSALFELGSTAPRTQIPTPEPPDYRLMPHLDLRSQNTKDGMKSRA